MLGAEITVMNIWKTGNKDFTGAVFISLLLYRKIKWKKEQSKEEYIHLQDFRLYWKIIREVWTIDNFYRYGTPTCGAIKYSEMQRWNQITTQEPHIQQQSNLLYSDINYT